MMRDNVPCLDQDKADAWDEGYQACLLQAAGIRPKVRNPYFDYTEVDKQAEE